ncbi:hypothetical protein OV208_32110 [Corallococcus sp. bb12-1]|uniref:hypothetical protein n=1 Tax=Corallococcus sp. bb12-1 TaxID=2996784 RepID=UPI00226D8F78|nr:hypothetical protein [Corallococcus sp. bb12-1]MCY1046002.1 hypothetical protein [Corallococcus sp. bb12-1]
MEADCADTVLLGQAVRDYGSETPFAVTRAGIPLRRVAPGAPLSSGQYLYDAATNVLTLASTTAATGLSPVYRLYSPTVLEHFWTIDAAEKQSAQSSYGYTQDEGIGFHAATASGPCLVPVYRLVRAAASRHTFTTSQTERASLVASGWTDEGIKLYAGAPQ